MGLAKKLLMKPGYRWTIQNEPTTFRFPEEEVPQGAERVHQLEAPLDFVLLFAHNQQELKQFSANILPRLKQDAVFWVAYPKKSSKIASDITRDSGWDCLKEAGYVGVSLVSLDDTWSAFRVRQEQFVKSARK